MPRRNRTGKNYQTWWEDLKPWIEQLYEDHRVYIRITVHMFSEVHNMRPVVRVEAYRVLQGRQEQVVYNECAVFSTESVGEVESRALSLVSRFLLALENERDRAERQADLWPALPL